MADEPIQAAEPQDRREVLAQQLTEMETAQAAPAQTAEERARDEKGKFMAKEPKPEGEAVQTAPEPADEPLWKRPPSSWKKDYHEPWNLVPDTVKEYAHLREEEMRNGVEGARQKAVFADQIQKAIAPFEQTIRGLGVDVPTAISSLMQADHNLRYSSADQKTAYFLKLAQQYGVNLSGVEIPADQAVDPRIAQLENQLLQLRGDFVGQRQREEEAQTAALQAEINAFAQGKEHFEAVKPVMSSLLQSGVAKTLDEAYSKAIRLDDTLFDQIQKGQQAQAEKDRREAADKAAKNARAAAVSVKSSTPGAAIQTKAQDRRSVLIEQFDGLSERF